MPLLSERVNSRTNHACRVIYYMMVTCFVVNMLGLVIIHLQPYVMGFVESDVVVRGITARSDMPWESGKIPGLKSPEILRRLMAVNPDVEQVLESDTSAEEDRRNGPSSPFLNFTSGAEEEWRRHQHGFTASHIEFMLNEPGLCNDHTFLFIMVSSAVGNTDKRQTIRDTWGSAVTSQEEGEDSQETRLVFLVGKPADVERPLAEEVKKESLIYRDIVQTNIIDSYSNLSFKSIAMLKWMTRYCKTARFLLKSDDDMFINVNKLKQELTHSVHQRFIMGEIIAGAQPMQDKNSKWYTPRAMFAGKMYPKYVSGSAYVISGDFLSDLYSSTLNTEVFWLEDVFITGLCAKKANAVHIYNSKFGYKRRRLSPCLFKNIVTCHRLSNKEMYRIWKALQDPNINCSRVS